MVRQGFWVHKYLTALATAHTIPVPTGRSGLGHRRAIPERSRQCPLAVSAFALSLSLGSWGWLLR
jgi:hypothetical protein